MDWNRSIAIAYPVGGYTEGRLLEKKKIPVPVFSSPRSLVRDLGTSYRRPRFSIGETRYARRFVVGGAKTSRVALPPRTVYYRPGSITERRECGTARTRDALRQRPPNIPDDFFAAVPCLPPFPPRCRAIERWMCLKETSAARGPSSLKPVRAEACRHV